MSAPDLPALLHRFFTDRLLRQLDASAHTVASYRDAFRLLLRFAAGRLGRAPSALRVEDLDAALVAAFLDHLESDRGNSARTRNTRLAAIHAFFKFVALEPELLQHCQRILAIPPKRHERRSVDFLTDQEAAALVAAPDVETWIGRRDRALLLLAIQTGLRNSEIASLRRRDVSTGTGAHVRCTGKGRKMRCTPLRRDVAALVAHWLREVPADAGAPLFPSTRGAAMSSDAIQRIVARHARSAGRTCQSLAAKKVHPHTLRHTAAMDLLGRGVDQTVIALWLGHESIATTQVYVHADLQLKERALGRATTTGRPPRRYRATDRVLAFLEGL
jgi:integrase/recombinase XerD